MQEKKKTTARRRSAREIQPAQEGAANAINAIPEALNGQNVLRVLQGVRFTHELEKMQEATEHSQALYMLLLRIRTGYMDVSIPLAGPLIESQAEHQRIIRSNQMGDAVVEWARYLAAREAQQSQDQPSEKA